ncbi:hypothetical protein H9P43_009339 [Blastocladiella emersonii ATCC 22665]|nr:hypothetical protein H9P43_009339 [Blastocladiella emersonii ATCC 22665]
MLCDPATHDAAVASICGTETAAAHVALLIKAFNLQPLATFTLPLGDGRSTCSKCPLWWQKPFFSTLKELIEIDPAAMPIERLPLNVKQAVDSLLLHPGLPRTLVEPAPACDCGLTVPYPNMQFVATLLCVDPQYVLGLFRDSPLASALPLEFWMCVPEGALDGVWDVKKLVHVAIKLTERTEGSDAMKELAHVAPATIFSDAFADALYAAPRTMGSLRAKRALGVLRQEE